EGGTHLEGFKNALTYVLNKWLDKNEKLKKKLEKEDKEASLSGEDVRTGIVAVLSMKVPEPQFEGQTKEKLGNTEVRTIVDALVKDKLNNYFELNPEVVEKILEKAVSEATARIAARKAKDALRKKSFADSFGLPEKLSDCSSKDPEQCEVYIVEGDSAGGSAKKGRDSRTQAILPLWGKMLNVEKVKEEKVMNNDKLEPVIAALGAGFGETFNLDKLRYHKIIIMADADVDGSHIRTLLLTFFFRYMPALIEKGYVYLAMPPLFKIQLGKNRPVYVYTEEEREAELARLGENRNKANVQRYKGLGEMDGTQLWETTMDPARRKMKVVTIPDAQAADEIFTVCMGEEVEPRRRFIEENAVYAKLDV
ncbi:MAG: DNA topoisomerase IV subunit B, partial [Spirochaetales bacterium]|nr:DNA topoisomerase IV subunit B [Spirochaetales bacterium]